MHAETLGSLQEPVNCDICVIGGGFSGLSAAFELSLRGFSVIILESGKIAHSASGKNGGQLQRGFPKSPKYLIDKYGKADAKLMSDVTVEGIALIKQRIKDFNIDCAFTPGVLVTAYTSGQLSDLKDDSDGWADLGYPEMRMLNADETQGIVHVSQYIGGQLDEVGGHFHPYNYAQGLARAAVAKGCRIYEDSHAIEIIHGDTPKVRTAKGEVTAKFVILGGAIKAKGTEALTRRSITAAAHVIATEPLTDGLAKSIMSRKVAVSDARFIMDYYRLSEDNRLLFGGNCNYSDMDMPGEDKRLRDRMLKIFPQLANTKIDHCWYGPLEFTINRLPGLGRLSKNVYYAHGFGGQGVVATNILGKVVAEAVAGQAERFDVFARVKHQDFPGGNWLKRPLFVLGMTWYRMRDALAG